MTEVYLLRLRGPSHRLRSDRRRPTTLESCVAIEEGLAVLIMGGGGEVRPSLSRPPMTMMTESVPSDTNSKQIPPGFRLATLNLLPRFAVSKI